jgi:CRISPR/Cas system-associated endoribonuclease Cas2
MNAMISIDVGRRLTREVQVSFHNSKVIVNTLIRDIAYGIRRITRFDGDIIRIYEVEKAEEDLTSR